ncbi:hypothetical protein [Kribbella shirazensis]|uniref:Uncharacterized protein n=1 Tax=Kribbella shirazensis TaxID=1105143 RepID=A0A7X6A0G2_9ACTN|nr:hypothetical protein [Kribbella shirazensis]NIK56913.1 hypothetical protein [Kribbella shirazensis]
MTDDDVEISPSSWEYRLVAAVVHAVERRAGGGVDGPRTRWNRELLAETDPDDLGGASVDGSLSVSVVHVLEPLREARDLDRPLTAGEAWKLRQAIATLIHEAAHLMTPVGDRTAPEAYPLDDAATAYDEGLVEHWTHRNLDSVITEVFADAGLDGAAAAVLSQPGYDAYPAYTPAARHLSDALAERSGLTSTQVTQKLLCADDRQRWNVAVDLVIDKQLPLMPEAHRAQVRRQLVAPLRESLSGLGAVEDDESLDYEQQSDEAVKAAQSAIAGLDRELESIQRKYQIEAPQLSPDLARLRAVTSGQAPPAGATDQRAGVTDRATTGPHSGSSGQQGPRRQPGPHRHGLG